MKITKNNIHMFLPIKVNNGRGKIFEILGKLDGGLYVKDHMHTYCLIKFEEWDFSTSLKDYSELSEQDWEDVFQAGINGKYDMNKASIVKSNGFVDDDYHCVCFDYNTNTFGGITNIDQFEAFRVLIEKLKR